MVEGPPCLGGGNKEYGLNLLINKDLSHEYSHEYAMSTEYAYSSTYSLSTHYLSCSF